MHLTCILFGAVICFVLEIKTIKTKKGTKSKNLNSNNRTYLLNSGDCKIPNFDIHFYKNKSPKMSRCGTRLVTLAKVSNRVTFIMRRRMRDCRYRFLLTSKRLRSLSYSEWVTFENGTQAQLRSDFVQVTCKPSYNDMFANIMKSDAISNTTRGWNLLVLGIDSMSRVSAINELPETYRTLRKLNFLDYRGHHKNADATATNLYTILSRENPYKLARRCSHMSKKTCEDSLIFKEFGSKGYVTALGEDAHKALGDFKFINSPTNHSLAPLYQAAEREIVNFYFCTGQLQSAQHILQYAFNFAQTYKRTHKFFGFFWTSSMSHDSYDVTQLDSPLAKFLTELSAQGTLRNTFLIILSDHGKRYGPNSAMAQKVDYYYEARLPMLFIRPPDGFAKQHPDSYLNLKVNQHRVVSNFDLHFTLLDIMGERVQPSNNTFCGQCHSLFKEVSASRSCSEAGIQEENCACTDILELKPPYSKEAAKVLDYVVQLVPHLNDEVTTVGCTRCEHVQFHAVTRFVQVTSRAGAHVRYEVTATLRPGSVGLVITLGVHHRSGDEVFIINKVTNTRYRERGYCAPRKKDKYFCACRKYC